MRRSASSVPRTSGCHSLALARYARATSSGEAPGATPRSTYGSIVKGYEATRPKLRPLKWMVLVDLAVVARDRWGRLEADERRRLAEILRKGRNVSDRDKADLRRIVGKLELLDAGRQIVPIIGRGRKKR